MRQALVLAGGKGTRLGTLTHDLPKPLMAVAGVPFLDHLLWNLGRHGIEEVVLSVGYLAERVREQYGERFRFGGGGRGGARELRIRYSVELEPAGTGGALRLAAPLLDDAFLVVNGDTLFDINYLDLALELHRGAAATVALRRVDDVGRYGAVVLERGRVTAFAEKSGSGAGVINGGVYAMTKAALELLPEGKSSLEHDLLPQLVGEGRLAGKAYDGFFIDIGLPDTLELAQQQVAAWRAKPAAFLDRDGVINVDRGYVHRREEFAWMPGARAAIKELNDRGYLVVVVTNQAGIARGYYTEEQFLAFSNWIDRQLLPVGAHFDATYYCPHHPTEGQGRYRQACGCRKPRPGLIEQAVREWGIRKEGSFLVGDKESDVAAAHWAGIRGVRFDGEDLHRTVCQELATKTIMNGADGVARHREGAI